MPGWRELVVSHSNSASLGADDFFSTCWLGAGLLRFTFKLELLLLLPLFYGLENDAGSCLSYLEIIFAAARPSIYR